MKNVSLKISIYEYAKKIAEGRFKLKNGTKKHKENTFSPTQEIVGLLGEMLYGYLSCELPDFELKIGGDDGFDFKDRVQVKATANPRARYLIEFIDKDFSKFDFYVFVFINLPKLEGRIVGWISTEDFKKECIVRDFRYGDRFALHLSKLKKWQSTKTPINVQTGKE